MGTYTRDGSLWENMVPFWTSESGYFITLDPMSNPVVYYIKWVVSETVGGFNAGGFQFQIQGVSIKTRLSNLRL